MRCVKAKFSGSRDFTLSRKPEKRPTIRRKRRQQFAFVLEHPQISPQDQHHSRSSPAPSVSAKSSQSLNGLSKKIPSPADTQRDCFRHGDTGGNEPPLGLVPNGAEPKTLGQFSFSNFTPFPSIIECNSLLERFKPVLTRYNAEFCIIPLTLRLRINPFRYREDLGPEPAFLMHAVMALAGHHLNSSSTLSHRHASLCLLRQGLNAYDRGENMYSVLDTIIILFSLDETQSMFGNWSTHLTGAYHLLEACGGIKKIRLSSRVETQIGILTWWDAIISLLSREECVFPYEYFEAVETNQPEREWDFFGLCGCPTSLAKIVMRVARLGAQRRNMSSPRLSEHDDALIAEIEQSLEDWFHVPAPNASREEEYMHQDLDAMHCSEAWRNGILLYIFRVFRWEAGTDVPLHVLYRARTVVDHVVSCREADMISRQALLPLFFAGCELRDESTKKNIVRLCHEWDQRTRYHIFRAAIPLLEEVWAAQKEKGFDNVWWGQVVDRRHFSEDYPLKMRLCFG